MALLSGLPVEWQPVPIFLFIKDVNWFFLSIKCITSMCWIKSQPRLLLKKLYIDCWPWCAYYRIICITPPITQDFNISPVTLGPKGNIGWRLMGMWFRFYLELLKWPQITHPHTCNIRKLWYTLFTVNVKLIDLKKFGIFVVVVVVGLIVLSRTRNISAIWQLSPLPVTGLQI
jgi:hypothetical protein